MDDARKTCVVMLDASKYTAPYDYCLLNALIDVGVDVVFVASKFVYDKEIPGKKYIEKDLFYKLSSSTFAKRYMGKGVKVLKGVEHVINMFWFYAWMRTNAIELLHVQWVVLRRFDMFFIRRLRKKGVKIVYTVHNLLPHDSGDKYKKLYKSFYSEMDALIAHTEKTKYDLITGMGVDRKKIKVMPIGGFTYLKRYPIIKLEKASHISSNKVVLFFGQIHPYKGVDILIDAFRQVLDDVPDSHLLIVGRIHGEKSVYKEMVKDLGMRDNVTIIDEFVPDSHIRSYMAMASVAAFPYRSIDQSAAVITAISLGLPVVASDVGEFSNLIKNDVNGYIVPREQVGATAAAITSILMDDEKTSRMRSASERITESQFSWSRSGEMTAGIYRRVLGEDMA